MMNVNKVRSMLRFMNLRQVARETGLHYNTVRAIESGKTAPKPETLAVLSSFLERHAKGKIAPV